MAGKIVMDRDACVDALRELDVVVVSLDRIGSISNECSDDEFRKLIADFVVDWSVGPRLAQVRRVLSALLSEEELDSLVDVEAWTPTKTKPSE